VTPTPTPTATAITSAVNNPTIIQILFLLVIGERRDDDWSKYSFFFVSLELAPVGLFAFCCKTRIMDRE
jgi:hypothetical protein